MLEQDNFQPVAVAGTGGPEIKFAPVFIPVSLPGRPSGSDKWPYYEANRSSIIADMEAMGIGEARVKWKIWDADWQKLRRLWKIKVTVGVGHKSKLTFLDGAAPPDPQGKLGLDHTDEAGRKTTSLFRSHDHGKADPLGQALADIRELKSKVAAIESRFPEFPPYDAKMPDTVQAKWLEVYRDLSLAGMRKA